MSAAPLLYKLLSPAECEAVAKYLGGGSPRAAVTADAGSPLPTKPALSPDHCATCGAGEFALPPERVTVDYSHGFGVWLPCPECRPAQAWAFAIRWRANNVEPGADGHQSEGGDHGPSAMRVVSETGLSSSGLRPQQADDCIERRDPWDLPDDELSMTGPLPREVPAYWGRNRGDFDELDTKLDIQPFGRTTR